MSFSVLITAASRRVALVKQFRQAINNIGGRLIAVDCDPYSSALYFSDKHLQVPKVNHPEYLNILRQIALENNVRLIIPTFDHELRLWAEARDDFKRAGITVSISPASSIRVCQDKYETYRVFRKNKLPFPDSYLPDNLPVDIAFPLFIKPRQGRGSSHSLKIDTADELHFHLQHIKAPMISTYLEGQEFTSDALFSKSGQLQRCVHRYRLVVRAGVSDRGRTFKNTELTRYIEQIGSKIHFIGAVNIQGKINRDQIHFFEINPRFSGGIQLSFAAGADFTEMIIAEEQGHILTPNLNDYRENLMMTSYEASLFIDKNGHTIPFPGK